MDSFKKKTYHDITVKFVKLLDAIFVTIPFVIVWYTFYADKLWVYFSMRGHWLVIGLYVLLYVIIGKAYAAFKMSYYGTGEMIYSQLLSLLEVNTIMYVVELLLIRKLPNVLPMLLVFLIQIPVAFIWSTLAQKWYFSTFPANKTVIIWDKRKGVSSLINEYHLERKFKVVATTSAENCIKDMSILDDADTVFIVGVHSHDRNIIAKYCINNSITAYMIPRIGDLIVMGARRTNMFHLLMLKIERYNPSLEYLFVKRLADIVFSILGLIVLSPVMLVTALCIKLDDKGPVFYKQIRLTRDGKEFSMVKFRSMRTDAEKDGVARLSTGKNDSRVTKVGRVIRRLRIDELPQLWNILKGEMTFVGPRAERPEVAAKYTEELPEFKLRLQAKAGLTGYAQVFGKYNSPPYDKLLMDLMYIANASVFRDISIVFSTVKILFMPDSTEGVEEGHITAIENGEADKEQ